MSEPLWKHLVDELAARRSDHPAVERLSIQVEAALDRPSLEREVLKEMADALGRAGRKVDIALAKLELTRFAWREATSPVERRALAAEHAALLEEAERVRHDLLIHREAIGLRDHSGILEFYPLPMAVDR